MRDPLFFIALLPDEAIQKEVTAFKKECADKFKASHALTSPPHITLHPPFPWPMNRLSELGDVLDDFAANQQPFEIQLSGFSCFKPRVLFVDVKHNDKLQGLQKSLLLHLNETLNLKDEKAVRFHAHMTIAHRDLQHWIFPEAWAWFSGKSYDRKFTVENISLMEHNRGRWEVYEDYPIG